MPSKTYARRYIIGETRYSYAVSFTFYVQSESQYVQNELTNLAANWGTWNIYFGTLAIYKNGTMLYQIQNNTQLQNFKNQNFTVSTSISTGDVFDIYADGQVSKITSSKLNLALKYDYETIYVNTSTPAPTWCYIKT